MNLGIFLGMLMMYMGGGFLVWHQCINLVEPNIKNIILIVLSMAGFIFGGVRIGISV